MRKCIYAAAVAAMSVLTAYDLQAQNFQTAYFLKNYTYSYQLSPASKPEYNKGFLGAGVDNISLGISSNVGVDSFLFPSVVEGRKVLVSGFDESISAEQFLGGLDERCAALAGASLNILSFGYRGKNDSFHTFEVNAKVNVSAGVPKGLFSLLKNGATVPATYTGTDSFINATGYFEIASGHSYRLNDFIRLGGRVKLLAGIADAQLMVDSFKAEADESIIVNASGNAEVHALSAQFHPDENGNLNFDLDGDTRVKPGGYGAALDFGVEMDFPGLKGLSMTASIQDLGGLVWLNGITGRTSLAGDIMEDMDDISIESLFKADDGSVNSFRTLSPALNVGVKYDLARMLTIGALATARAGRYASYEARVGASFNPGRLLSLAASAGVSSFGAGFGAALSLNVPGFNLFVGTDSFITEFTPEYVPVSKFDTRLNLGLVIAF